MHSVRKTEDETIEMVFDGDVTVENLNQLFEETLILTRELASQGKKALILADNSRIGKTSLETDRLLFETIRDNHFDKVAGFGSPAHIRQICNAIFRMAGKYNQMRQFVDRELAISWLTAESKNYQKVFLNESGIIECIAEGEMDTEALNKMNDQVMVLAQDLKNQGKKILILSEVFKLDEMKKETQAISAKAQRSVPFDKVARVGASPSIRKYSNDVAKKIGKLDKTRYFLKREEAMEWLLK